MEHSLHYPLSLFSAFELTDLNLSLPTTTNSLSSLDFDINNRDEKRNGLLYEPSTVLLLKGSPHNVSDMEFLTLCSPYGILKDILVIKHKGYAFIEFETLDQAIKCYQDFKKVPPKLKDFTIFVFYTGKSKINKPEQLFGLPSRFLLFSLSNKATDIDAMRIIQLIQPFGNPSQVMLYNVNKNKQVFVEMRDITQAILAKESIDGNNLTILYLKEDDFSNQRHFCHQNLSHTVHYSWISRPFPPRWTSIDRLVPQDQEKNNTNSFPSHLINKKEEKPNNIVIVKNLPKTISARILFRLFGICGNVMKVKIFFKNPENALVEYQDHLQANVAIVFLNNCPLLGNYIKVAKSKQGTTIENIRKGEENQYTGDYSTSIEHRYKFAGSKNHYNVTHPSRVLHLSNLCEEKEESFYRELFQQHGHIKKFAFLKSANRMALVELDNVSEAVNVLVSFHNYDVEGKFLKVSFSKYPKIKEFK